MARELDEHTIIDMILSVIGQPKEPYSKIGDDVAVLPVEGGKLVVKADMLVGRTDLPVGMKLWEAARKSIVACVSDFAAKGVQPKAALVSLGLPRGTTRRDIQEIARGFKKVKDEFRLEIIGGDTNEADDLIIDCCMIGFAERVTWRHGAAPGDILAVSGSFGYPPLGLKVLQEGLELPPRLRRRALLSVLLPTPRLELGVALNIDGLISSSIDSSDGLALSLHQLAAAGKVGFEVNKLPAPTDVQQVSRRVGLNLEELVLYAGEEYEIVMTIPERVYEEAWKVARGLGSELQRIGRVTGEAGRVHFDDGERRYEVERKGWIHLAHSSQRTPAM